MSNLPKKYKDVAKAIIPYVPENTESQQMALINIEPSLPCFLCGNPANMALAAPAPEYAHGSAVPWLTFPICRRCETAQVQSQSGESD